MIYTVYKTVNKVNGKFYIGVHKTSDPMDGYLGSGTYIRRAVMKYGAENFSKEILFEFGTQEEAWAKENELVELYRSEPLCMNIRKGGSGGFDYINSNGLSPLKEAQRLGRETVKRRLAEGNEKEWNLLLDKLKLARSSPKLRHPTREESLLGANTWKGSTHTDASRRRISDRQKGPGNSQFGTFWITDGTSNKKCRGEIPDGWRRGRN